MRALPWYYVPSGRQNVGRLILSSLPQVWNQHSFVAWECYPRVIHTCCDILSRMMTLCLDWLQVSANPCTRSLNLLPTSRCDVCIGAYTTYFNNRYIIVCQLHLTLLASIQHYHVFKMFLIQDSKNIS
jgi:hypothetical protein